MEPGKIVFQGKIGEQDIIVRSPTLDDIDPLLAFINEASSERTFIRMRDVTLTFAQEAQYLEDVLSKMKEQNMIKLVAFCGDEVVGAGDVTRQQYTEKHIGLYGILVKKSFRGKGIGKKLTELCLQVTKEELPGIETLILTVYGANSIAQKMYRSFGFTDYGRLPNGRKLENGYDDVLLMHRPL